MSLFTLSSDIDTQSRELNNVINSLLYVPKVKKKTFGLDSLRFHCAKLRNKMFKYGNIQVNDDKKHNVKFVDE